MRFRLGISAQLAILLTVLLGVPMAILAWLDIRQERTIFRREMEERGSLLSTTLADRVADPLYYLDVNRLRDVMASARSHQDVAYTRVYDREGSIVVDSTSGPYPLPAAPDEMVEEAVQRGGPLLRFDGDRLSITNPVIVGRELLGTIQVGFTSDALNAKVAALWSQRLRQTLALAAGVILVSLVLASRVTRPLRQLAKGANTIGQGDLTHRIRMDRNDEVGDLARALNDMAGDLDTDRRSIEELNRSLAEKLRELEMEVTERKRVEEALRENEERYRDLYEEAPIAYYSVGLDSCIRTVNRCLVDLLGYARDDLVGQPVFQLYADTPAGKEKSQKMFLRFRAGDEIHGEELEMRKADGRSVWISLSVKPVRDAEGGIVESRAIAVDITERKRAEETVRHLAYHDVLTDLPNRTLFKDRLTLALAQARRNKQMLAVMFLDLDRFKVVNDTAGHPEGDQLLQSVGKQLKELARESDTVARVGGDEFTLLFPGITRVEDAVAIGERILKSLQQPRVLAGHEFHITTSIGITIYPDDSEDAETLLRNADIAMYRAKEEGRNNYQLYTPAMNIQIAERLALENDLRHGLEREEFVVYYQPQVNLKTSQIVGMEALVRWQHPDRGLVLPMEFIPVAEETGLIVPLGEWVLRTACAQNRAWQEAGLPPLRVAVNLSAHQFQRRNLRETVAQVLKETGLDPHWLQLEIT
ncbi:MAG: diguanylate cyclase domain-containing protein, partial [Dehalococcoidia bacterium]